MSAERFVLDASVALEWLLPGSPDSQAYAAALLGQIERGALAPVVPDFWHYEAGSALLVARRSGRIGAAKLNGAKARLAALQLETLAVQLSAPEVIEAGLRFYLQGYDAVYFELARRLNVAIASLDGGIRMACKVHRVKLLPAG